MSRASASDVEAPSILISPDDNLLPLFSRQHQARPKFTTYEEFQASYAYLKQLYEKRGEPGRLKRNMQAMVVLGEKAHQLSPRKRERVKVAFDTAALLLESKASLTQVELVTIS